MVYHDQLQQELEEHFRDYIRSQNENWTISIEHYIDPETTVSSRRIDVGILIDNQPQNGYAIEIKTADWSGQILAHQLRDHIIGGFIPIVVTPEDINQKMLNAGTECSLNWVLDFLSVSIAAPSPAGEYQFELCEDRLSLDDPLRDFFKE